MPTSAPELDLNYTFEEKEITSADFLRISDLIFRIAGIVIHDHKRDSILSKIRTRIGELSFDSVAAYLDFVEDSKNAKERQYFCNSLTTNLTSFFRDQHHFDQFAEEISALKEQRALRLRIWSAGCSTGQEAYSIALMLTDLGAPVAIPDTKVLATDIDTSVLRTAKTGSYTIGHSNSHVLQSYPELVWKENDQMKFDQKIKNLISFKQLNVLGNWPMRGPFDVIFCRNVAIYFSEKSKFELIERFANILRPGGVLFLGHSETILGKNPKLKSLGMTSYRRI